MPVVQKRLRCFVAMAIGYADTDGLCDSIESALKPLGIDARRVDRIVHNDDIDKRIISEIEAADFVIADLTYARPSVYFEAGYAQRAVPVVYTVRKDHFHPKPEDVRGNLRVHFDLQMRNIIPWQPGSHNSFLTHLRARVKRIVAPLVAQKQTDADLKAAIAKFNGLSIREKQAQLVDVAQERFRKLGYKIERKTPNSEFPVSRLPYGSFIGTRQNRKELDFILVHATPSLTVFHFDLYRAFSGDYTFYHPNLTTAPLRTPKRITEDFIICSLASSGTFNRLHKRIPYLRFGDADHTLIAERPLTIERHRGNITVPRKTTFHVFESTPLLLALNDILSERFK
jgi:nucleoside 2-deoxyribosyltransferase